MTVEGGCVTVTARSGFPAGCPLTVVVMFVLSIVVRLVTVTTFVIVPGTWGITVSVRVSDWLGRRVGVWKIATPLPLFTKLVGVAD